MNIITTCCVSVCMCACANVCTIYFISPKKRKNEILHIMFGVKVAPPWLCLSRKHRVIFQITTHFNVFYLRLLVKGCEFRYYTVYKYVRYVSDIIKMESRTTKLIKHGSARVEIQLRVFLRITFQRYIIKLILNLHIKSHDCLNQCLWWNRRCTSRFYVGFKWRRRNCRFTFVIILHS